MIRIFFTTKDVISEGFEITPVTPRHEVKNRLLTQEHRQIVADK
jgi:hypothetical protein